METSPASQFLRTVDIPGAELDRLPDGLHQIFRGDLDVLIVRGALSAESLRSAVEQLESGDRGFARMPQEFRDIDSEQIFFYGDALSHNSVEEHGPPMDRYLVNAAAWQEACRRLFATEADYETQLTEVFRSLSGDRQVAVPCYVDGRSYCPSTIRMIPPGRGAPFHIDNYLQGLQGWEYLSRTMDLTYPINFFTMMSSPSHGGEIEVSELRYNDPRAPANGSLMQEYDGFAHQRFATQPGDLFVFASGRHWHRVCEVQGPRPRWTIGGFLGFASDDQTLYYWG